MLKLGTSYIWSDGTITTIERCYLEMSVGENHQLSSALTLLCDHNPRFNAKPY